MTKMVVFLGNPGQQYERTRHNAGTLVSKTLELGDNWQSKFHGFFIKNSACVWLKPQTYMNESGISVQEAAAFFNIEPKSILIVHDDLELDFGEIKMQNGGGLGGHNGLRSVKQHLGTDCFARLRFGIGRPNKKQDVASYVLSKFSVEEENQMPKILKTAAEKIQSFLQETK